MTALVAKRHRSGADASKPGMIGTMTEPADIQFRPARPRRAFDEIIDQVRAQVRQGKLPPGSRLPSERTLAAQFEVSRNTVREAIRMLEVTGVVTIKKGATGGAFIAPTDPVSISKALSDNLLLTRYSLSDLTEAREEIETVAVTTACARRTDDDLARMEDLLHKADDLAAREDWNGKTEAIIEFHCLIGEATQNPIIATMMRSLMDLLTEFTLRFGAEVPTGDALHSPRALLEHIRRRDADAAVAELVHNTRRVHHMWLADAEE
ncbi:MULTISPECIES: FadR/GntR family transcriptional regulator [Rhodococcus]|uniref:FadR family transcriptional regulator n=1 Tax=Rhodococcus pseudokoreensis TaxID=2811421 RepID=A0A974ZW33_9NOCA|nr:MULTISPECIES: FadR/GntR family transcriptional regulator [Rhodococcus]KAF0960321.1 Pyruvate dehydrogenase complex repressor [Rhodococcus sp. T7]QSE92604.1 FadR family transcriptional regulator [Rhodococcus pseudokoreensis]